MNMNKRISQNFILKEMCGGRPNNIPQGENLINAMYVVANVLQPLRDKYGRIRVTSFFRNLEYNRSVGSSDKSQHTKGQAVDIQFLDKEIYKVFLELKESDIIEFDQVIYEDSGSAVWLHISCKTENNRNQFLTANKINGKMTYEVVE